MGWDFTPGLDDKKEFVQGLLRSWKDEKTENKCLRYSLRGNELWTVWEIKDLETSQTTKIINLDRLSHQRSDGWGYKSILESAGPYYYNCPLSFFKIVPDPPNTYAAIWRQSVIQKHKAKYHNIA